jgi:hypothetical protein
MGTEITALGLHGIPETHHVTRERESCEQDSNCRNQSERWPHTFDP